MSFVIAFAHYVYINRYYRNKYVVRLIN